MAGKQNWDNWQGNKIGLNGRVKNGSNETTRGHYVYEINKK